MVVFAALNRVGFVDALEQQAASFEVPTGVEFNRTEPVWRARISAEDNTCNTASFCDNDTLNRGYWR